MSVSISTSDYIKVAEVEIIDSIDSRTYDAECIMNGELVL